MIDKIYIICKNPKESIDVRKYFLENGGFCEDKTLKFFLDSNSEKYFVNPKIIELKISEKDEYVYSTININFLNSKFNFDEQLKELNKQENVSFVSYDSYEKSNFTKDFNLFDKKYIKEKQQNEINDYIKWRLESGTSKLYDYLKDYNENYIEFNNEKIDVIKFISLTDNISLLKYCINNKEVFEQFKSDPLNIEYDKEKQPKCFKYIEEQRELVQQENYLENYLGE